jgi:hypothetical protein
VQSEDVAQDNTRSKTDTTMAYDEKLAKRVRDLLADETNVTEKRMFGRDGIPHRWQHGRHGKPPRRP